LGFYNGTCHGNAVLLKGHDANFFGRYCIRFYDGMYVNYTNCIVPIPDTLHENYWGPGALTTGGYTPYVTKNEWVSVIYTYDGTNAKLYINCQLVVNNISPGLTFTNPYDLLFGKMDDPLYPYWYKGVLDDVRIYNRPLNEDEVFYIVNNGQTIDAMPNQSVCNGDTIQLNVTGGSNYLWSPANSLNNSTIASPLAFPGSTTEYFVTSLYPNGCIAKDSLTITVNPSPVISKSNDTLICSNGLAQLYASGGNQYLWFPAATLSNATIPNPVASPGSNTTYSVTVTNSQGCSKVDSVNVTVRQLSSLSVIPSFGICKNETAQLTASGGDLYAWTPTGSLSNSSISNPVANPDTTTIYSVTITDTVCNYNSVLTTTISVNPLPVITAVKSNDIDCANSTSQLSASGALQYNWTPDSSLSNSTIFNPVASPLAPTTYVVTGVDANGCENTDSITVDVTITNVPAYLMPTAFTPNADGLNDCYGLKYWGMVESLEFSVYNRWGERVFFTKNPGDCWDGTFKGKKQGTGVFVYMIKAKTNCSNEIFRKGTFTLVR